MKKQHHKELLMIHWKNAGSGDLLLLKSIKVLLRGHPRLMAFLFHPTEARLKASPKELLYKASAFSSGEYILVQVALDFWDGSGDALLSDLYATLDGDAYFQVLMAIESLKGREIKSIDFNLANEKPAAGYQNLAN